MYQKQISPGSFLNFSNFQQYCVTVLWKWCEVVVEEKKLCRSPAVAPTEEMKPKKMAQEHWKPTRAVCVNFCFKNSFFSYSKPFSLQFSYNTYQFVPIIGTCVIIIIHIHICCIWRHIFLYIFNWFVILFSLKNDPLRLPI